LEKDYYRILGLDSSATREEITQAYRRLAAKYHPDKHQGNPLADLAEEKFKDINEAYHALTGDMSVFQAPQRKTQKREEENITPDAKDLLYKGINCYNEGKFKKAIQYFESALEHSKTASLYNLLGLAYCEEGDYKRAIDPLVKATQLDEENGKYYFDAGYVYYRLGMWEIAIQFLLDAYTMLEDSKRLGAVCIYIAICNYNIDKAARAEFFLEEAVNYDPDNISYRILLEEFRQSQEAGTPPKPRLLNRINRFSFATRFEDSIGNLFRTLFSK